MDGAFLGVEAPFRAPPRAEVGQWTAARPATALTLALRDVSLSFGGVRALKGVSLDVRRGEIRAIIGPNGAGKSSLVNVISGLYRADAGSVTIGERSFARVPAGRLAALGVARTFQNLALFPQLSARANIASGLVHTRRAGAFAQVAGLRAARRENAAIAAAVEEIAALLHLDALVARPDLLLLDEPMAGMTPTEKAEMAGFLRLARAERPFSVILMWSAPWKVVLPEVGF
jgi:branched-chain amino acid transport system ATP-binding protein